MALIEEAHKAAHLLLDHAYVRVVARAEPDAVCAAALVAHALRRENVDFHFSAVPALDADAAARLAAERHDALVLVGLSAGADGADALGGRKIVLEREAPPLAGEAVLDPDKLPEKAPAPSLASLAYFVAISLSKRNRDLAALALAGAMARFRHADAFAGLDADVLAQGLEAGTLERAPGLALHGPNLAHALAQLDAPFVEGVTGRARNVRKLLADLHLSAEAPVASLAAADAERLGSVLALRLLGQQAPDAALSALFRPALRALAGPFAGLDASALARQAEAACAEARCGLAFATLWPDPSVGGDVLDVQGRLRERLVAALLKRDPRAGGPLALVDAPSAGACAPLAHRYALSWLPAGGVAVARHLEGDRLRLALRSFGDRDVGRAARRAVEGGPGVAAGARRDAWLEVPASREAEVLKRLEDALA